MTNEEIKKAWNTVKKAMVKKDSKLNGAFRMTAKQMANGTATVCLCNNTEYDDAIADTLKENAKVQAFETWTEGEKARYQARTDEMIANIESRKAQFETKANEAKMLGEMIISSKEFKAFQALTGATTEIEYTHMWGDLYCYYLRVNF